MNGSKAERRAQMCKHIAEYLTQYGPSTARSITENLNAKYGAKWSSHEVAQAIRTDREMRELIHSPGCVGFWRDHRAGAAYLYALRGDVRA